MYVRFVIRLFLMPKSSFIGKSRLRANLGPDPSYPPEEVELWRSRPPASEALKLQLAWMYTFHDLYYFSIFVHLDDSEWLSSMSSQSNS